MAGTVSRTARVSGVTRNLKEAEGKILARRIPLKRDIRGSHIWARGPRDPKPNSHPEDVEVDAAGMWDEGRASYPGRSVNLPCATATERWWDGLAEVSRRHISWSNRPVKG